MMKSQLRRHLTTAIFLCAIFMLTTTVFGQEGEAKQKTFLDVIGETSALGKLIWVMILGTSISMVTFTPP